MTTLGLSDELYWNSTPREIHACILQYYRKEDTWNTRFGIVAAQMFNAQPNTTGRRRRKIWDWIDFFRPITRRPVKVNTAEDLRKQWEQADQARKECSVLR